MLLIIIRILIMIFCMLPFLATEMIAGSMLCFLVAFACSCFCFFFSNRIFSIVIIYGYLVMCMFFPNALFFFPILVPDIIAKKTYPALILYGVLMILSMDWFVLVGYIYLGFGCILASVLQYICILYENLLEMHKKSCDDSREMTFLLQNTNQVLRQKQDYEIHNATLKERNRIAREIHDNVGHLITRCILMTGALKALNKDEACFESINVLEDTLSNAMENIRNSVHNLHDTSIDLKGHLEEIVKDYSFCTARLVYDAENDFPSAVRYAFISIVKEAFTNTAKHSSATKIDVTVREHPALYQLVIEDNGATAKPYTITFPDENRDNAGIGLINMYDRVKSLQGSLQIMHNTGFKIFVMIPKEKTRSTLNIK